MAITSNKPKVNVKLGGLNKYDIGLGIFGVIGGAALGHFVVNKGHLATLGIAVWLGIVGYGVGAFIGRNEKKSGMIAPVKRPAHRP